MKISFFCPTIGCYQCIVQSEYESSQASAQLKLGDSAPVLVDTFKDQMIVESGASVSLRCAASASPLPQIKWYLDDQNINAMSGRYRVGDYVTHNGHVISFVNISAARVIDGGEVSTITSLTPSHHHTIRLVASYTLRLS